ncbi:MAG: hypothetical protein JXM70_24145 [Pirellulales bacterium]|nr:hypothetical protein [Pirellulales bacterium]
MTDVQIQKTPLPISLYFMPEWWDRYYHVDESRPAEPSQHALESLYLGRQRFLREQFGRWEIGQEKPDLEGGQIATLLHNCYDTVPVLLGRNAVGTRSIPRGVRANIKSLDILHRI